MATRAGIYVVIAAGEQPSVIGQWLAGQPSGTLFHAKKDTIEPRKRWLFGAPVAGVLRLDRGACAAIEQIGSALLAIGVLAVQGQFSRGDKVHLCDEQERTIAQGISRYTSEALRAIPGHHSLEIPAILGYQHGAAVVHRDDMIVNDDEFGNKKGSLRANQASS